MPPSGRCCKFLTFPLTFLTLGLFLLVLNAFLLKLASLFTPGFAVHGFLVRRCWVRWC